MSTATSKGSIGSTPPSTAASINLPDDRTKVSEWIVFYELLIKERLEDYLSLHDSEIIRKIRNAANDCDEEKLLLRRAFEENPTLLDKLKEASGKAKGKQCCKEESILVDIILHYYI